MLQQFTGDSSLILTEADVQRLILREKKQLFLHTPFVIRLWKAIKTLVLLLVIGFALLNAPALYLKVHYLFQENMAFGTRQTAHQVAQIPTPDQAPAATTTQTTAKPASNLADNHLFINSIKVDAPINWDVAGDNTDIITSLQSGVSHLSGNAHPGERGTIFIVGHSSYYLWSKGAYKQVFALLDELTIGDTITVTYHGTEYNYRVTKTQVVSANEVSVRDNDNNSVLKLMTCWPVGTNAKRYIVSAEPIDHNTNLTPLYNATIPTGSLPITH